MECFNPIVKGAIDYHIPIETEYSKDSVSGPEQLRVIVCIFIRAVQKFSDKMREQGENRKRSWTAVKNLHQFFKIFQEMDVTKEEGKGICVANLDLMQKIAFVTLRIINASLLLKELLDSKKTSGAEVSETVVKSIREETIPFLSKIEECEWGPQGWLRRNVKDRIHQGALCVAVDFKRELGLA